MKPHRRYNPLTDQWILVSPQRIQRPWSGQVERAHPEDVQRPEHDPNNPLCPGVRRPNGRITPNYTSTYVFDNDFPALIDTGPAAESGTKDVAPDPEDDLFRVEEASGVCKVMCFSPKSNVSIPLMSVEEIVTVIETWKEESVKLSERYSWVQIFENKGAMMGCSNPHPHCQIWASSFMPNEVAIKDANLRRYFDRMKRPLLLDYSLKEMAKQERVVCMNQHWLAVVPFWATWPYETMILPKEAHILRLSDLNTDQTYWLAHIMKTLTIKYDNLFGTSFPYTMGFHGAPTGPHLQGDQRHWQLHALFYPPLLRSATVKKFMVGYELLANVQRDLTPEQAAQQLRLLSGQIHYSQRNKTPMRR